MDRFLPTISLLLIATTCWAHGQSGGLEFIENLGQWHENVRYKLNIPSGALFLESDGFTYSLIDHAVIREAHTDHKELPNFIQAHAFQVKFLGCTENTTTVGSEPYAHYRNYFIGNDRAKWASGVLAYSTVQYENLYDGIDLNMYSHEKTLKYDLIVAPGADPAAVRLNYEGPDTLYLNKDGNLIIGTRLMEISEQHPFAFQIIDGEQIEVPCAFHLEDGVVSFVFPRGHDRTQELIIDPELKFSTYVGSSVLNFGSSACYDGDGHLYGSGTTFGTGYPTTIGAYQVEPGQALGGTADIGISKFSPDGTSLIYSTYLGGSGNETVHSTVVNANGELHVLGTSISNDFPLSANAFQTENLRGETVNWTVGYGMSYAGGCDMIVSKLSADGMTLLGSTYVGGSGNDGINAGSALDYNYGDPFRGEINVDDANNIFVASCTESPDFPLTGNAAQSTFGGGRDGIVFKMNPDLSNMIWATYAGGSENDNAYAVQFAPSGELVVAGGTLSTDFPTTPGVVAPNGNTMANGWVMKLSSDGSTFINSTYVGTSAYDQVYFVQLDPDGNIFVLGQTNGIIPVIPTSVYSNANSGQFIQKFDDSLSNLLVSTTVGSSSGRVDISPTAFLVSNCGMVFLSGWGGSTNDSNGSTTNSTTNGLPITADAFQSTTDGDDFYLMVLDEDLAGLSYATYFGGDISSEHVDGGTSRFDKNGVVYQAVCAGCGGLDDFPSTPEAWSPTNPADCNLGVFKFDLGQVISMPELNFLSPNCVFPFEVEFTNNSVGANSFLWEFGDGTTSEFFEGNHMYDSPGDYQATLHATDSSGCLNPDSTLLDFTIHAPPEIIAEGGDSVCPEEVVPLNVIVGHEDLTVQWNPSETIENPTGTTTIAVPSETTTYYITATDSWGCETTDSIVVHVNVNPHVDAGADGYLSPYGPVELDPRIPPGASILWSPTEGLSCTDCVNPTANPDETTTYLMQVTNEFGCVQTDSLTVYTYPTLYVPNAFTPGPDQKNPVFRAFGHGIRDFTMTVHNRWGELIFVTNDMAVGWDGSSNGLESQQGVYVYKILYTTDVRPKMVQQKVGHVTLLRNTH